MTTIKRHLTRTSRETLWENAFTGVLAQKAFSINPDMCAYRMETKKGKILRCGIGQSIPDDLYNSEIEGLLVAPLVYGATSMQLADALIRATTDTQEAAASRKLNRAEYLRRLQRVHDTIAGDVENGTIKRKKGLKHFKKDMLEFAERHRLKIDYEHCRSI